VPREVVSFRNGDLTLQGVLYRPKSSGSSPALLYNHGSAPGTLNDQAFDELGPLFAGHGWVFFAPYRRGQGLSAGAGPYIGDEIAAARSDQAWKGFLLAAPAVLLLFLLVTRRRRAWVRSAWGLGLSLVAAAAIQLSASRASAATMVRLLEHEHLSDQVAAFQWLREQSFVEHGRIATAGNSFGGVEAVFGAERLGYCAAVDAAGGAENWSRAPQLQAAMRRAVGRSRAPIFFFQAENDYDLSPSRALSAEMKSAHKMFEVKLYPAFGTSSSDGHRFAWSGSRIWGADVLRFLEANCSAHPYEQTP
jgi:carboxymethylenebutenolidase